MPRRKAIPVDGCVRKKGANLRKNRPNSDPKERKTVPQIKKNQEDSQKIVLSGSGNKGR